MRNIRMQDRAEIQFTSKECGRMSKRKCRPVEEALLDSGERYRRIVEQVTGAIWAVDMNMRPTCISSTVTRLLGYSVQEAMTKPMEEAFTPISFKLAMDM